MICVQPGYPCTTALVIHSAQSDVNVSGPRFAGVSCRAASTLGTKCSAGSRPSWLKRSALAKQDFPGLELVSPAHPAPNASRIALSPSAICTASATLARTSRLDPLTALLCRPLAEAINLPSAVRGPVANRHGWAATAFARCLALSLASHGRRSLPLLLPALRGSVSWSPGRPANGMANSRRAP